MPGFQKTLISERETPLWKLMLSIPTFRNSLTNDCSWEALPFSAVAVPQQLIIDDHGRRLFRPAVRWVMRCRLIQQGGGFRMRFRVKRMPGPMAALSPAPSCPISFCHWAFASWRAIASLALPASAPACRFEGNGETTDFMRANCCG